MIQFHNHIKEINKSVDFDLLCCYVLLMQVLILELFVVNSPSNPHCSPVSSLASGKCLSTSTFIPIFQTSDIALTVLGVRSLYRASLLPFYCLLYLCHYYTGASWNRRAAQHYRCIALHCTPHTNYWSPLLYWWTYTAYNLRLMGMGMVFLVVVVRKN